MLWLLTGCLYYVVRIYGPTLEFKSRYYLLGEAGKNHLDVCETSTDKLEDLIVDKTLSSGEIEELLRIHGSGIFQSILTKETAQNLRDYAVKANQELPPLYVHANEHRRHVIPPHTEPVVQETLKQIADHPTLRPLLDSLLGPSATLMSLSLLTSEYGAEDQDYHYDSEWSSHGYPTKIVPEYTIAIALQDTTHEMGATGFCPGTHKCAWPEEYDHRTLVTAYYEAQRNGEFHGDFDEWSQLYFPCQLTATVKQGDALLYSSDLIHAGRAHTDEGAPQRIQLFVTLAASRSGPNDVRHLPIGNFYSLNWDMWGQTIGDFSTMKERPWRPWHSLGLFHGKDDVIPWNLWDAFLVIFRHPDQTADMILSEEWDAVRFSVLVNEVLRIAVGFSTVYVSTLAFYLCKGSLSSR